MFHEKRSYVAQFWYDKRLTKLTFLINDLHAMFCELFHFLLLFISLCKQESNYWSLLEILGFEKVSNCWYILIVWIIVSLKTFTNTV